MISDGILSFVCNLIDSQPNNKIINNNSDVVIECEFENKSSTYSIIYVYKNGVNVESFGVSDIKKYSYLLEQGHVLKFMLNGSCSFNYLMEFEVVDV